MPRIAASARNIPGNPYRPRRHRNLPHETIRAPFPREKRTDIHRPIRTTPVSHEIRPLRNLLGERLPRSMRITVPRDGRITLLSRITGTRQVHHSLAVGRGTLVFVQPLGMIQRKRLLRSAPNTPSNKARFPFHRSSWLSQPYPSDIGLQSASNGSVQSHHQASKPLPKNSPSGIFPIARPGQAKNVVTHRTGQHKATPL